MAFVAFNSFQKLASSKKRVAGGGGGENLLYYNFESSTISGSTIKNLGNGGSTYDGTIVAGATFSTPPTSGLGRSLAISTNAGGILSSSTTVVSAMFCSKSIVLTAGCSIAFWIKLNTFTAAHTNAQFWGIGDLNNAPYCLIFRVNYSGNAGQDMTLYTPIQAIAVDASGTYANNAWVHYVFTFSTGNVFNSYTNGVKRINNLAHAYPFTTNPFGITVGGSSYYNAAPYGSTSATPGGAIDEFRVYNKALTQQQVTDVYNKNDLIP